VLGGLTATVPSTALYKSKDLLHWTSVTLNNGSLTAIGADALHLVAYLGDATGDGAINSQDVSAMVRITSSLDAGYPAFQVADPAIVSDIVGDGKVDGANIGLLNPYCQGKTIVQMPAYPGLPSNFVSGPDPTLSVQSLPWQPGSGGSVTVPVDVNIDDPRPAGSTGMTEATLALSYDPAVLSLSTSDIHLGTVPDAGSGWTLQSVVNPATGQIGVTVWSPTPIDSSAAGSLVTIDFHRSGLVAAGTTSVDLVSSVDPRGLGAAGVIHTQVDDDQGPYTLTYASTDAVVSLAAAEASATDSASAPAAVPVSATHVWPVTVTDTPLPVLPHLAASVVIGPVPLASAGAVVKANGAVSPLGASPRPSASAGAAGVPQHLADDLFTALARGAVDPAELAILGSGAEQAVGQALAAQMSTAGFAQANLDRLLWDATGETDWLNAGDQSSAVKSKRDRPQGLDVSMNE